MSFSIRFIFEWAQKDWSWTSRIISIMRSSWFDTHRFSFLKRISSRSKHSCRFISSLMICSSINAWRWLIQFSFSRLICMTRSYKSFWTSIEYNCNRKDDSRICSLYSSRSSFSIERNSNIRIKMSILTFLTSN